MAVAVLAMDRVLKDRAILHREQLIRHRATRQVATQLGTRQVATQQGTRQVATHQQGTRLILNKAGTPSPVTLPAHPLQVLAILIMVDSGVPMAPTMRLPTGTTVAMERTRVASAMATATATEEES